MNTTQGPPPPKAPGGLLQNGMVVYFEECKKSAHRKALKLKFRGHGFGIMLGVVPLFKKDPTRDQIITGLAGVGFVLLDDVAEFLGEEMAAKFTEEFHKRYDPKPEDPAALVEPETPKLLGADGQELAPPEPDAVPIAEKPSGSKNRFDL